MEEQLCKNDFKLSLEDLFKKQMVVAEKEKPLEFLVNEDHEMDAKEAVLTVKPFGLKPPLIRIVASQL